MLFIYKRQRIFQVLDVLIPISFLISPCCYLDKKILADESALDRLNHYIFSTQSIFQALEVLLPTSLLIKPYCYLDTKIPADELPLDDLDHCTS